MIETTKEMIAVMQAYCNGKEIEYSINTGESWKEVKNPSWNWASADYRVKQKEPEYLPFDFTDAKSLIGKIVKYKNDTNFLGMITSVSMDSVTIGGVFLSHEVLLKEYLFLDDSICGKLK
jgi:hypothetical protein